MPAPLVPLIVTLLAAAPAPYAAPGPLPAPRLFAPGVVSTRDYERDGTFTPDGREFYFTKRTLWPYHLTICVTRFRDGRWSEPEVAPFSGQYDDLTPFVTPAGDRLYFASRRPLEGKPRRDFDLYVVAREAGRWGAPLRIPAPVNTDGNELAPSLTRAGALYFTSIGAAYRILRAPPDGEGWQAPAVVSDTTQADANETAAFVDPDERWLFEVIGGREDALRTPGNLYPRADLYVRERNGNAWSAPRHLPAPVNSEAEEGAPFLSPDGRYFFFMSERGPLSTHGGPRLTAAAFERILQAPGNGLGDIRQVDFGRLGLRP